MSRPQRTIGGALVVALVVVGATSPAHAQGIPVFDVSNLQKLYEMASRTVETLRKVEQQYELYTKIAKGIENLTGYRIPGIQTLDHDLSKADFGKPLLDALNGGDPRGDRYYQVVRPLKRPGADLDALGAETRQAIQAAYATIEIMDSVGMMGIHQSAIVRQYHNKLGAIVDLLENDVVSQLPGMHQLTAIVDKVAAAQLVNRRSDMAGNQLLSHVLEQQIAGNKRKRDAEAANMNMRLTALEDDGQTAATLVARATSTLQDWRLP
jgi:hypothetical protein